MKKIKDLKIKIFADGANIQDMFSLNKLKFISGFTTNPSLMSQQNIYDYKTYARKIIKGIKNKSISFEVTSDSLTEMENQAQEISNWSENIYVKIPFVNSVWEMNFFEIEGQKMNLSVIEHKILRKEFNEPRIHFAIVCASKSCPRLLNMAYEPEKLEEQLSIQTRNFVNDNSKNEIEVEEIRISSIFKWFKNDFIQKGTIQEFIIPYSNRDFDSSAKVKYLDYDWSLNGE